MLGQIGLALDQQALYVLSVFRRHGHELRKGVACLHFLQPRCDVLSAVHFVELVGNQQSGNAFVQQRQHLGISCSKTACIHHKQHQVHIADRTHDGFVERAVQGIGVVGLKTRGVDKNKLRVARAANTSDTVACGLRFARSDADFLTHQGIQQSGFAHIGLAHNGHQAAALRAR